MKTLVMKKTLLWVPVGLALVYLASNLIPNLSFRSSEPAGKNTELPSLPPTEKSPPESSLATQRLIPGNASQEYLKKEWAAFKKLKPKVLKNAQEQEEYYSKLESRELLAAAVERLEALPTQEDSQDLDHEHESRAQRLVAVDWLDEALSWKENPRRSEIIEKVTRLVSREVTTLPISASAKETLAGDKIELIGLLAATDPALASRLEQAAAQSPRGGKDVKLFKYARSMYGLPDAKGTN